MILNPLVPVDFLTREQTLASAAPLLHTDVEVKILGGLAAVHVRQKFQNPLSGQGELEYLFPLPEKAAVTGFSLRQGERVIRGVLETLESAQKRFKKARQEGSLGGLLERRRPNLFALQLTQLRGGEAIEVELEYLDRIGFNAEGYEFVLPLGLTPKYDRFEDPEEGEGVHAPLAWNLDMVGKVSIRVQAETGIACGEPQSPSHTLNIKRLSPSHVEVRLSEDAIPDRDFVLRMPCAEEYPSVAAWLAPAGAGNWLLANLLPPRDEGEATTLPREFIFVLDRSGSMDGEPIVQAKNALKGCLRTLNPQDNFRILLFDHRPEWLVHQPLPATQKAVWQADSLIDRIEAEGGTEIIAAIQEALSLPVDKERRRYVIFLTDGAVSAEAESIRTMTRLLGSARLFTFGVGSAVNRALLNSLARLGRGTSEFLQNGEEIEAALMRFQDRIAYPALTDLKLVPGEGTVAQILPEPLPDLYYGQALEFSGKVQSAGGEAPALTLTGKLGTGRIALPVHLMPIPAEFERLAGQFAAQAFINEWQDLEHLRPAENYRTQITELALAFSLASAYTAFSAVEETPSREGKPARIAVAVPLPAGLAGEEWGMMAMMSAPAPLARQRGRRSGQAYSGDASMMVLQDASLGGPQFSDETLASPGFPANIQGRLRLLARLQRMDGSWEGDAELTAVAILAFFKEGQTTRNGHFRQNMRKALAWLAQNTALGFGGLMRERALQGAGALPAGAGEGVPGAGDRGALRQQWDARTVPAFAKGIDDLRVAAWKGMRILLRDSDPQDPALIIYSTLAGQ